MIHIDTANPDAVKVVQRGLGVDADGIWGPITQRAWNATIGENPTVRLVIGRALTQGASRAQIAYMLATAEHETGGSLVPNGENLYYTSASRIRAVWPTRFPTVTDAEPFARNPRALANHVYNGRMGNRPASQDGWVYRGRGLVHITGRQNYILLGDRLGVDLAHDPDLALRPDIAVDCLVIGMLEGLYTGHRIGRYIGADADRADWINARKVVNGLDRAEHIAGLSRDWLPRLT